MKDKTRRELREQARELAKVMQGTYTVDPTKYEALLEQGGASFVYYVPLLLDENAAMRKIVQAMAKHDGEVRGSLVLCSFCAGFGDSTEDDPVPHDANCPVTKARALLDK